MKQALERKGCSQGSLGPQCPCLPGGGPRAPQGGRGRGRATGRVRAGGETASAADRAQERRRDLSGGWGWGTSLAHRPPGPVARTAEGSQRMSGHCGVPLPSPFCRGPTEVSVGRRHPCSRGGSSGSPAQPADQLLLSKKLPASLHYWRAGPLCHREAELLHPSLCPLTTSCPWRLLTSAGSREHPSAPLLPPRELGDLVQDWPPAASTGSRGPRGNAKALQRPGPPAAAHLSLPAKRLHLLSPGRNPHAVA